jgi:PleD family two-component response regulator
MYERQAIRFFLSNVLYTKNSLTSQNENSDGKRRILAVDDDPDTTLAVKMALEDSGLFQVDTFNDPSLHCHLLNPDYTIWFSLTSECQGCMGMNYTMK